MSPGAGASKVDAYYTIKLRIWIQPVDATILLMNDSQRGFAVWFVVVPVVLVIIGAGFFVSTRQKSSANTMNGYEAPNNPELTTLSTPYYEISDMSGIGPYSSNNDAAHTYIMV